MIKVPHTIKRGIHEFLEVIRKRYTLKGVYLYGSHAKGTASQWSDIDLAVVSPDFSDDLFQERLALMLLSARIDDRIEPRPFNLEAFNENDPVVEEINKHGIRLA